VGLRKGRSQRRLARRIERGQARLDSVFRHSAVLQVIIEISLLGHGFGDVSLFAPVAARDLSLNLASGSERHQKATSVALNVQLELAL
jgi:hypothetical protein